MNEHMGYPLDDTRLSDPIESYELFCNTAQNVFLIISISILI